MLNINHLTPARIIASLPCKIVWGNLMQPPSKKSLYHQGFFAVKRRAVFILGAKWKALVRGWRRDCVVGGMETHFQWRKAHSRTAKCEAFHFASRLFFMFLFFVPIHVHNLSPVFIHWPYQMGRLWAEKAESTARERKCVIISHLHIGKKKNHHKNEKKRQFDSDNYFFFINLGH